MARMFEDKHSPEARAYYADPDRPRVDKRRSPDGIRHKATNQVVVNLSWKHHEALRMAVLGYEQKEISRVVGMSRSTLNHLLNSPVAKEQIDFLRGAKDQETYDVAKQIQDFLPECVSVLKQVVSDDSNSDSLRSKNALALLAIGGHGPTKNVRVNSSHLDVNDLIRIKQRAMELAIGQGTVVDVESS